MPAQGLGACMGKVPTVKDVPKVVDFEAVLAVYPEASGAPKSRQHAVVNAISAPPKDPKQHRLLLALRI